MLYAVNRSKTKRDLRVLMPSLVSDEVADFWRNKINASAVKRAKATDNINAPVKSVHDIFTLDRAKRELYEWLEVK